MTMTIEIINDGALNLLSGMERLNLIRVNVPANSAIKSDIKLSKQFAGALKLSETNYESFQNLIQESRNEVLRANAK